MSSSTTHFDRVFDSMTECFTPEVARKIADLRADDELNARLDELARKANEGQLTPAEETEYKRYVEATDVLALFKRTLGRFSLGTRHDRRCCSRPCDEARIVASSIVVFRKQGFPSAHSMSSTFRRNSTGEATTQPIFVLAVISAMRTKGRILRAFLRTQAKLFHCFIRADNGGATTLSFAAPCSAA